MKIRVTKRRVQDIVITVFVMAVIFVKFVLCIQTAYPASENALNYIKNPAEGVTVVDNTKTISFIPENPETGFIFYPGGLVEPDAYAPLMEQLAENGIMCVIVRMPHFLAIFDANGARGIREQYPEIKHWYIGGHSLGGAMASMYGDFHNAEFDGIVFLASYATIDMSQDDIDVLLLRGDQDKVLNMEKYTENLSYLPKNYKEYIIKGGCHAYFGDYGPQKGDGTPTITVEEQTDTALKKIVDFME